MIKLYIYITNKLNSTAVKNYTYDDSSWGDLLTSYNGDTITYDAIGNPLQYRNGISFTWENGRQLKSYTKNNNTVSYTYDSNGMRLSKEVNGVTRNYLYNNGLLMQEIVDNTRILDYSYDSAGNPISVAYRTSLEGSPTYYYFALNSRGDVIGIYAANGSLVVVYEYDAWGNVLSVKNANGVNIANPNSIANIQSLRYRGYCYDTDSGLYYLQSRYYDPVTHRFINTDGYVSTGTGVLGHNMFVYCNNNPIMLSDNLGNYPTYSGITFDGVRFSNVPTYHLGFLGQIKEYWIDNMGEVLYENTTVKPESNDHYTVSIPLESYANYYGFSHVNILHEMKELNQLIINRITEDSDGEITVNIFCERELWGEIALHTIGYIEWDQENCKVIDLEISKYSVMDQRDGILGFGINASSIILGCLYGDF